MQTTKECPNCNEVKDVDCFSTRTNKGMKYPSSWCKSCSSERDKLRRSASPRAIEKSEKRKRKDELIASGRFECTKCLEIKPIDSFPVKGSGVSSWCRGCMNSHKKMVYSENTEVMKDRSNRTRNRVRKSVRQFICEYLEENPCIKCGESDIVVLEFDHRDPSEKLFEISYASNGNHSMKRLKDEIDKCDVLCANCHRRKSAMDLNWYRTKHNADVAQK